MRLRGTALLGGDELQPELAEGGAVNPGHNR